MLTSDEQAAFITIPPADLDDDDGGNDTAEAAQITLYTFSAPENASSFREAISEDGFLRTIQRDLDETGVDPATGEEFTFTTSPDAQVSDRVVVLGYDAFTDAQLALLEGCGLTGLTSEDARRAALSRAARAHDPAVTIGRASSRRKVLPEMRRAVDRDLAVSSSTGVTPIVS
jgi:hypothetical protein